VLLASAVNSELLSTSISRAFFHKHKSTYRLAFFLIGGGTAIHESSDSLIS
jgi:hypothetical protein